MTRWASFGAGLIGCVVLLATTAAPAGAAEGAMGYAATVLPPLGPPDLAPLALGVSLLSSVGLCLHGRVHKRSWTKSTVDSPQSTVR